MSDVFFDINNIHERLELKLYSENAIQVFISGPPGSGKSTIASIIAGLLLPILQNYQSSFQFSLVLSSKAILTTSISKSVSVLCSTKAMVFYLDSTPILHLAKTRYH